MDGVAAGDGSGAVYLLHSSAGLSGFIVILSVGMPRLLNLIEE